MNRRTFLKLLGAGVAGCRMAPGPAPQGVPAARRPNFLVVLCDDLGYGDLGCYGSKTTKTPHIDHLAREGLRLTDCYASAPVCSPSRAGLLTGRTPHRCGVYDWIPSGSQVHLRRQERTVAAILKQAGYATCHVGKWHLNGLFNSPRQPQPNDHGFEHWFATQNNAVPSHRNPRNFVRNGQQIGVVEGYSSDLIADEAIRWLKERWDRRRPFFQFICFHAPHEPIATAEEFLRMYEGHREAIYWGNVTQLDHAFGRVLKALDELGLRGGTMVLFTSDNGPEILDRYPASSRSFGSPGPLRGMKLHIYEGGIRVPGIIRLPGRVRPGGTSAEPVSNTDILPTLCELAGAGVPDDRPIDGTSLVPLLAGRGPRRRAPLYWRYDKALSRPMSVAMREGDWKILADGAMSRFELYNLRDDIGEKNDLAAREPRRLAELSARLRKLHAEIAAEGPLWPTAAPATSRPATSGPRTSPAAAR